MKRIIPILIICLIPMGANAASYNFYVDKSYDGDEEGTSEKPFNTIREALEEAAEKGTGERSIYIKSGTYDENFNVIKGAKLYGQDKNNTIINGSGMTPIVLEDENTLENLTLSGGISTITVNGKATINKCVVKNASKNGIDVSASSAQITIKRSELTKNGKGAYIQKERNVSISENYVHNNTEEGLDFREKIRGTVWDNDIVSNGEGGIEIIAGSSNVTIKNNDISKNKASGIANQFYSQASKTGKINIIANTISRNGHFGIFCGAPSGGNRPAGYWEDSLDVSKNKIEHNEKKSISGSCDLIKAVTEEEKKTNETLENPNASTDETVLQEEEKRKIEEELSAELAKQLSIAQENEERAREILKQVSDEKQNLLLTISQIKAQVNKENKIKFFFTGPNQNELAEIYANNEKLKDQILPLEEALERIDSEEILGDIQKLREEINFQISENEKFLDEKRNAFNLNGWFRNIFRKSSDIFTRLTK